MPDKIVCTITGATGPKERDRIKETLKENNNCVLIASYGCVGTGITLSNLCFGVLFESFKSDNLNMQSLGRGLGLSKFKDKYIVYDIIDCFIPECGTKSLYRQGLAKIKIYNENKYDNKIVNINL
jgi:superfamily II DNA or RNA helicase